MVITRHKDGIHVDSLKSFEEHHVNSGAKPLPDPGLCRNNFGLKTTSRQETKPYSVESELTRSQVETMKDFIVNLK